MTDISTVAASFGEELTRRAAEHLQHRSAMFGDPKTELFNKARVAKLILDAAGVTGGVPYTPRVHAAVELGKLAVGLLRGDPKEVLADAVAHISCLAQVEGIEQAISDERKAAQDRADSLAREDRATLAARGHASGDAGEAGRAAVAAALGSGTNVHEVPLTDISQPQGTVIDHPEHGLLRLDGMRWVPQNGGDGWLDANGNWFASGPGAPGGEQPEKLPNAA